MKKMNTLLLISLFSFPIFLLAQAPGYLGKKAMVTFALSSLPAINGPTQNNKGSDGKTFGEPAGRIGFNYELEAGLSYVISRYRSLSVNVAQYYTGAQHNAQTVATGTLFSPFVSEPRLDRHELFSRVNVKSITLRVNKFNSSKGGLAPVGNRIYYGLKRSFISSEVVDRKTDYFNGLSMLIGHRKMNIVESMTLNFFQLGWRNDQVFWDKVILSMGIRFNLPLNFKLYNIYFDGVSADPLFSSNPNQSNYNAAIFERIANHEILRLDIGVGLLLF